MKYIFAIALTILVVTSNVTADTLLDQIGPMDGSGIGGDLLASQDFESALDDLDIIAIDNFLGSGQFITEVEVVIGGWAGFVDPSSITLYVVNLYSSPSNAESTLVGDIASWEVDPVDVSINPDWTGNGFLLSIPTQITSVIGDQYLGVLPSNVFSTDGQTGIANSLSGDGGFQANPEGGFGFGTLFGSSSVAYRIHSGDPCAFPLEQCAIDIDGDNTVAVGDLLAIIDAWGNCGDGNFRPLADIAPLPNGDCCVNVSDALAVIDAWGDACEVVGACCLGDGSCDLVTVDICTTSGGEYFGDNSGCVDITCDTGACCINMKSCNDLTQTACVGMGGHFYGESTSCSSTDCSQPLAGDECVNAIVAVLGSNPFDTRFMTVSQPQPSDEICDVGLDWEQSPDVWFIWTATENAEYTIDTCDTTSYDTSMIIYEGSCNNQIACSGDAQDSGDGSGGTCQQWYSSVNISVTAGEFYYIRLGGWQGATGVGTINITADPIPPIPTGACCLFFGTCQTRTEENCAVSNGTYFGDDTECADATCAGAVGDECITATVATLGINNWDTLDMTASQPQPDEEMCIGTSLAWNFSPDQWMVFTPEVSGMYHFTTCDWVEGFDTSMVLYEEYCLNQVACNGDSEGEDGCQSFYSAIDYHCIAGVEYFLRFGGWEGEDGPGICNITLEVADVFAACCVLGDCIGDLTADDCAASDGDWLQGELCQNAICPEACPTAQISQRVHEPTDYWQAGTSADDLENTQLIERAEFIGGIDTTSITVWGFQGFFSGGWFSCSTDFLFNIRGYADNGGVPGALISEQLGVVGTKTPTGIFYVSGTWELMQWDFDFNATNVDWISVQSAGNGENCWLLWMSSPEGDGDSAKNDQGNGWINAQGFDLSICVD